MDYVTPQEVIKRFSKIKDHQPVELAYMTPLPTSKDFKDFLDTHRYGDQKLVKIARIHTITNCRYAELPYVKAEAEKRDAAIAAGTAKPKRAPLHYEKIIPGVLEERNGMYYFLTYPREGSKTEPGRLYCVLDENDEIIAQYDTVEPLREFIADEYFNRLKVDKETGEIIPNSIQRWRLDRMYEVWPE